MSECKHQSNVSGVFVTTSLPGCAFCEREKMVAELSGCRAYLQQCLTEIIPMVESERDEARAEVARLTRELAEAKAERDAALHRIAAMRQGPRRLRRRGEGGEVKMKIVIEVVVDETEDAVPLIREAATKLKRGSIVSGETVNYCLGDYRVTLLDESIDVVNKFVSR